MTGVFVNFIIARVDNRSDGRFGLPARNNQPANAKRESIVLKLPISETSFASTR